MNLWAFCFCLLPHGRHTGFIYMYYPVELYIDSWHLNSDPHSVYFTIFLVLESLVTLALCRDLGLVCSTIIVKRKGDILFECLAWPVSESSYIFFHLMFTIMLYINSIVQFFFSVSARH